jgi:hypothetical protein
MKDKALRKLLAEKGLIRFSNDSLDMEGAAYGLSEDMHIVLRGIVHELKKVVNSNADVIDDMAAKFDAINKHYGIEVERQDARYVVKEGE